MKSLWIILAVMMTAAAGHAGETIAVIFDKAANPMQYADEKGDAAGLYPALIREIFKRMKVAYKFEALPWKRAIGEMEGTGAAIGGMYWNEKRGRLYDFSDPLYYERLVAFVKKGKGFPFHTVDDFKGKRIGINLGWSYGNEFDAALEKGMFTVERVLTNEQNYHKLVRGRVDVIIVVELSFLSLARKLGIENQVELLPHPVTVIPTHIVFSKRFNRKSFLQQINAMLKSMRRDGTYDWIVGQYSR